MLDSLVKSKTARKILTIFITNPDNRFYIRQLERLVKEPVSAVRRELQKLEHTGFLISKEEANLKYYSVNKRYPIFEEIKNIVLKTQGLGDAIRELIKKTPGIKIAFIYGSVAKGEEKAASDMDLMIIGNIDSVRLHSKINEIESRINRTINYSLINEKDFKNKKTDFMKRILREKKVFLIGEEDELRRLSQSRKD